MMVARKRRRASRMEWDLIKSRLTHKSPNPEIKAPTKYIAPDNPVKVGTRDTGISTIE